MVHLVASVVTSSEKTLKQILWSVLLITLPATHGRAQTITSPCNSVRDSINTPGFGSWILSVTITNSTVPLATNTFQVSNVGSNVLTMLGQPSTGVTTEVPLSMNSQSSPSNGQSCVSYAQTFSMLVKNGAVYANRVGYYTIAITETDVLCCNGLGVDSSSFAAKGLLQYKDYDLSGNVISVMSGTFTGVTPPTVPDDYDFTDPFWNQFPN
jgi:hypothetical protein